MSMNSRSVQSAKFQARLQSYRQKTLSQKSEKRKTTKKHKNKQKKSWCRYETTLYYGFQYFDSIHNVFCCYKNLVLLRIANRNLFHGFTCESLIFSSSFVEETIFYLLHIYGNFCLWVYNFVFF